MRWLRQTRTDANPDTGAGAGRLGLPFNHGSGPKSVSALLSVPPRPNDAPQPQSHRRTRSSGSPGGQGGMRAVRQRIGGGFGSANMAATAARWAARRVLPCACSCARLGPAHDIHHQPHHALRKCAYSLLFAFGSVTLARAVEVLAYIDGLGDSVSATSHGCAGRQGGRWPAPAPVRFRAVRAAHTPGELCTHGVETLRHTF